MTGNPKYKAQEDYYDEIQILKKVSFEFYSYHFFLIRNLGYENS